MAVSGYDGSNQPVLPSFITLTALFKAPDANGLCVPVDVNTGTGRIQFKMNDTVMTVEAVDSTLDVNKYTINKITGYTGLYKFQFLTTGMAPGLYDVIWTGIAPVGTQPDPPALPVTTTIQVLGQLGIGAVSRVQDFINRIRFRLMDDHPEDYLLDKAGVFHWNKVEIFECLRDALSRFNSQGPRQTAFSFEDCPADEMIVTGGVVFALYARARFEGANAMQYTDGHSLHIDRGPFYKQLADTLYQDWTKAVEGWKKSTPPSPIGMKSQRLPFRIYRVMGMLPNYQTYFSG